MHENISLERVGTLYDKPIYLDRYTGNYYLHTSDGTFGWIDLKLGYHYEVTNIKNKDITYSLMKAEKKII